MIGIPYIQQLFTNILKASLVMQGRFYISPLLGSEINNSSINEYAYSIPDIKWPATLMILPNETGNFQFSYEEVAGTEIGYNTWPIQMLFLRPAAYTAYNQPSQPLANTQIPTHTIAETQHDMARCAKDFIAELRQVLIYNNIFNVVISEVNKQSLIPVANIGVDKLSGVLFRFNLLINGGCDIEDYAPNAWLTIPVPPLTDTHPTHINS